MVLNSGPFLNNPVLNILYYTFSANVRLINTKGALIIFSFLFLYLAEVEELFKTFKTVFNTSLN